MNAKIVKLVLVSAENNNKEYLMEYDGNSSTFKVTYGRIQSTSTSMTYPISKWDSKYKEKIKKNYQDVTHTVAVEINTTTEDKTELAKVKEAKVQEFLDLMQKYTKGLVAKTYTVKAKNVTITQVNEAQNYINSLMKIDKKDITLFNSELLKLYMIIPRYMSNVKDYLLPAIRDISKLLQQEQDSLDALESQIKIYRNKSTSVNSKTKKEKSFLDILGIQNMKEIKSNTGIESLTKQITGKRIQGIFEIKKEKEEERLAKWLDKQIDKTTKFVYHGTKSASVIPILQQGLLIRPTGNFQFSGKVYGNGNYFSEQFNTSIGYTDGHKGQDSVLLIYEVHTGKESKSSFRNYAACKEAGYDSFEGGWLRVAYDENQTKIKYIIWLK